MKTENIVLYSILAFVIGILVFSFAGFFRGSPAASSGAKEVVNIFEGSDNGFQTISSGSTDSGDVSIELTPKGVEVGKLKVGIAVNTHSVDLSSFDLKKITTLDYGGKSLNPVSAPALGGHHVNGDLVFATEKDITSFVIKIKGIPKVEERIFSW